MLFFLFNTFCGVCCKKHANLLVPFEMVGLACCFLYVVHLGFLLLDSLVVDVLIVRHELVDGARWGQLDDAVGYRVDELVVVATSGA